MDRGLSKYTIDELAQRVEDGDSTSAQKAESLLVAKSLIELNNTLFLLRTQMTQVANNVQRTIENASEKILRPMDELSQGIQNLNSEIYKYSKTSDRSAKAMKWLTFGLFFVGIAQVVVSVLQYLSS